MIATRKNIEDAILSTFLSINELGDDLSLVYPLDTSIFTTPYKKRVSEKLNGVKDGAYGFLSYQIEEDTKGTKFEHDWVEIISQNSLGLGFSKKYHDKLVADDKVKGLV